MGQLKHLYYQVYMSVIIVVSHGVPWGVQPFWDGTGDIPLGVEYYSGDGMGFGVSVGSVDTPLDTMGHKAIYKRKSL